MGVIVECSAKDCERFAAINICYSPLEVWSCDEHYKELYRSFLKARRKINVNLGQTVDTYSKSDGSIGKITVGKAWEIESRTITPEGRVVNKHTGRDPQY